MNNGVIALPDYFRQRFISETIAFGVNETINKLTFKLLDRVRSELTREYGIYSLDLTDDKVIWDAEKRGQIFDCILNLTKYYDCFANAATIIGYFSNDPVWSRQVGRFKKQVSFLLKNGDDGTNALLIGTVALGLLKTNNRLNEDIRKRSKDVGPDRFDRWLDIREPENELHKFLSVVVKNSEKERNDTSQSITALEDDSGGAQ